MDKQSSKNKYGQYFTPPVIAEFMVNLADITTNSKILEPSCGQGVFLDILQKKGFGNITAIEIDQELAQQFPFVRYESFISAELKDKFDLVIGNPPYIRWKNLEIELKEELSNNYHWLKYFNSLCDYLYIFILKSIELLNDNGQLIFICPEYWMNTTHSESLRNYMIQNGYFEEIYHFNETPIFSKVTVSTIIFKFIKSKRQLQHRIHIAKTYAKQQLTAETLDLLKNKLPFENAEYLSISPFKINERWILESDEIQNELKNIESNCFIIQQSDSIITNDPSRYATIGDICDIGNGMVSGLDKAFQIKGKKLNRKEAEATIKVLKAKDLEQYYTGEVTPYIFIKDALNENQLKKEYPTFYMHLQVFKEDLEKRYQYNRKINYWEWVFLRNFNLFNRSEKRIFIPCKERISNKNYFRFALVNQNIFPTQDVTAIFKKTGIAESIEYILAYLNNYRIFNWLKCNGIVKGNIVEFSEAPIASIPFRMINWNNEDEVILHDLITNSTDNYLKSRDSVYIEIINESFNKLFSYVSRL